MTYCSACDEYLLADEDAADHAAMLGDHHAVVSA